MPLIKILPENKVKNPTEDQEQIALMQWASFHPICKDYLIHIPNGGSRNLLEAKKLKAMGVKSGVSDLFLAYPMNEYSGLWIELKRKGGKLRISQERWGILVSKVYYKFAVCYGFDEAKSVIENYLVRKYRYVD